MINVFDAYTGNPLVASTHPLPTPSMYYSVITDARMAVIVPFYAKDYDTCFVVKYRLINVESFEEITFTETYFPYLSNPRSDQFFSYLHKCFPVQYGEGEAIIGTQEKVQINWDVLGGFAYPVISQRWLISLPEAYVKNHLNDCNKEETED